MQVRPRTQVHNPAQVRLLKDETVGFDQFKKGDVVTVEQFHADKLVEAKRAEALKESEKVESVNRWEAVTKKDSKKQEALNAALEEAAGTGEAKSATVESDEPLKAADADNAGSSMRVTRTNPQVK